MSSPRKLGNKSRQGCGECPHGQHSLLSRDSEVGHAPVVSLPHNFQIFASLKIQRELFLPTGDFPAFSNGLVKKRNH